MKKQKGWTMQDIVARGFTEESPGIFKPLIAAIPATEKEVLHKIIHEGIIDVNYEFQERILATFEMIPVPKPRMTKKSVKLIHVPDHKLDGPGLSRKRSYLRYFAFKDNIRREAANQLFTMTGQPYHIIFHMPMPASWSEDKMKVYEFTQHESVKDADNMLKAIQDCLMEQDKTVWDIRITKVWARLPRIIIKSMKPFTYIQNL